MSIQDHRNYSDGEILSFIEADNEAEQPQRLIGFFTLSGAGIRTNGPWYSWSEVRDVQRVPVILDPARFVHSTIERVRALYPAGLADADRKMFRRALTDAINDLVPLSPEPPQWTTVKVTYSDPGPSPDCAWDYYTRDTALGTPEEWMGPNGRVSWSDLQKMGSVEIMPTPKEN